MITSQSFLKIEHDALPTRRILRQTLPCSALTGGSKVLSSDGDAIRIRAIVSPPTEAARAQERLTSAPGIPESAPGHGALARGSPRRRVGTVARPASHDPDHLGPFQPWHHPAV